MNKYFLMIIIYSFMSTSYSVEEPKKGDLKNSIITIQKWVSSLDGKTKKQIKLIFPKQKPFSSTWEFNKKKELLLEYKFHDNTVLIYFLGDKSIKVSIQFLSK